MRKRVGYTHVSTLLRSTPIGRSPFNTTPFFLAYSAASDNYYHKHNHNCRLAVEIKDEHSED